MQSTALVMHAGLFINLFSWEVVLSIILLLRMLRIFQCFVYGMTLGRWLNQGWDVSSMDGNNHGINLFFHYGRNIFFPSILGRNGRNSKNGTKSQSKFRLPFSNLTNINIFFMLFIHIYMHFILLCLNTFIKNCSFYVHISQDHEFHKLL